MGSYLVRRFGLMLLTLFGISVIIFLMLRIAPGNIADILFDAAGFVDPTEKAKIMADFVRQTGVRPGLATVLVGENSASQLYVKNKHKACAKVGMTSFQHELPAATSQMTHMSMP